MEGKKVNMDYLCTITENNGKTASRTVDIPQSVELIAKLEGLRDNPNATVLDMQAHMDLAIPEEERRLINYISPNSYASSFIYMTSYPRRRTYESLQSELKSQEETYGNLFEKGHETLMKEDPALYSANKEDYVRDQMEKYQVGIKREYFNDAKRFCQAYNYTLTVREVKGWPELRMYSTDTVGWSDFTYKVTDDITIVLRTNFGYGSASYFRLGLRYKGVDILPYSFMVRYYYANMRDLIRYTRVYSIQRDSWNTAFAFVEKTANLASADSAAFLETWVLNEVREMVGGLHKMLENPDYQVKDMVNKCEQATDCDYLTVRNMWEGEKKVYGVYPDEMTMAIKAEKITGALDFLVNLGELSQLIPDIEGFIAEIKEMAVAVIPGLDSMVKTIEERVAFLREGISRLQAEVDALMKELEPHEKAIDKLYENRGENRRLVGRETFQREYARSHKDYADTFAAVVERRDRIEDLEREIRYRQGFADQLTECRKKVSDAGLVEAKAA
jgi:hypothetical protein